MHYFSISTHVRDYKLNPEVNPEVKRHASGAFGATEASIFSNNINISNNFDFATGIIEGFRGRLQNRQAAKPDGGVAGEIVKIEDPRLLAHIEYRYPHTHTYRFAISNQDEEVLEDGRKIGRRLVISKGIAKKSGNRQRLIE